jgi:hypothetical protein
MLTLPRAEVLPETLQAVAGGVIPQFEPALAKASQFGSGQFGSPQTDQGMPGSLEAVLIIESRPSRQNPGSWAQMYQAGNLHINLSYQNTKTGGSLEGQVISIHRLKLAHTRIDAAQVIGVAQLETEFGDVEASGGISANGDFEIKLEHVSLYPLTLRLVSQHGLDVTVTDLGLY